MKNGIIFKDGGKNTQSSRDGLSRTASLGVGKYGYTLTRAQMCKNTHYTYGYTLTRAYMKYINARAHI